MLVPCTMMYECCSLTTRHNKSLNSMHLIILVILPSLLQNTLDAVVGSPTEDSLGGSRTGWEHQAQLRAFSVTHYKLTTAFTTVEERRKGIPGQESGSSSL